MDQVAVNNRIVDFARDLARASSLLSESDLERAPTKNGQSEFNMDSLSLLGHALDDAWLAAKQKSMQQLQVHRKEFPLSPLFCDCPLLAPMGMGRRETAITQVLAWLLSPNESHGLGDRLLLAFVDAIPDAAELKAQILTEGSRHVSAHAEFSAADVGRADIVIFGGRSPGFKAWTVVVEAKVDASEGKEQSIRYATGFTSEFGECRFLYLTPDGKSAASGHFTPMRYRDLARHFIIALKDATELPGFSYARYFTNGMLRDLCGIRASSSMDEVLRSNAFEIEQLLQPSGTK